MFPIVRVSDFVQSYCQDVPSGPVLTGSENYFVDGLPAARVADLTTPGNILTGSTDFFIDGLPACRIIDQVECGIITTGSESLLIP